MARTLPTQGVAPIDGYLTDDRAVGHFEHAVTPGTGVELHTVDVVTAAVMASGKSAVGLNVAVTPTGTAASWVSGIYAKVTQGSTKAVNGYISAAEFEVINGADNVSDWFVLVLNAQNNGAQQGSHSSYIALRDYGSLELNSLFWFGDITPSTTDAAKLFTTDSSPGSQTHALRFCDQDDTVYWIMVTTHTPA